MRSWFALGLAAALVACGSGGGDGGAEKSGAADKALQLLDPGNVGALLSPEAHAVVSSYERDVRSGIASYKASFGHFPQSFADIPTAAALRETAVNVIADGLAGQVPFASRATLERAANAFVAVAERRILDQMKAQDAPNQ